MPDFLSNAKMNQVSPAGPISPMTFICPDGTQGNFMCRQATAPADLPIGVSQTAQDITPNLLYALSSQQYNPAPAAGEPGAQIAIYTSGDVAPIRLGVGGATPGMFLTNDTAGNGVGIAAFTANRYMGGVALQNGLQGDIIELYILPGRV